MSSPTSFGSAHFEIFISISSPLSALFTIFSSFKIFLGIFSPRDFQSQVNLMELVIGKDYLQGRGLNWSEGAHL